jgi:hypothetical protein
LSEAVPYAGRNVIVLARDTWDTLKRCVRVVDDVAHREVYTERVDRGAAEVARYAPGNRGVMMGYDFHLTADGPRLIEINTNAGGALLNALHSRSLCSEECADLGPVQDMEAKLVQTFREEYAAVRGPGAKLERVAIVDESPRDQFLYSEFALFVGLFARAGIDAQVVDTQDLDPGAFDLAYWRDTDFSLEAPRSQRLRSAYLRGEIVVSPSPREHHLLANKERMTFFSSAAALASLGCGEEETSFLTQIVPETQRLCALDRVDIWEQRRHWVFKPASRFSGKAVYRGDKVTRGVFEEIANDPAFLAQRRVEPAAIEVDTTQGLRKMKFDVRAYAYRGEVLMLGARVYQGQITNFRSPGGGFSGICVAP